MPGSGAGAESVPLWLARLIDAEPPPPLDPRLDVGELSWHRWSGSEDAWRVDGGVRERAQLVHAHARTAMHELCRLCSGQARDMRNRADAVEAQRRRPADAEPVGVMP